MQRADGGVASGLLLFASTPQSIRLAAYCQLPGRGAFNSLSLACGSTAPSKREPFGAPLTKSCPRWRGKWHGEAMTKGERLKGTKSFELFPLSRLTPTAPPQAREPFWCAANQKLSPFTGKVDTKWPKGERLNQPKSPSYSPSVGLRRQLPRKRWSLFARFYLNFILAPP